MPRYRLLLWLLLLALPLPGVAQPRLSLTSPVSRVSLLELYTSEGCSSCPPAERWLSELRHDPGLWQRLVPVALHVDYWDSLGWHDRFARPAFSQRQRRYATEGAVSRVYTPGFVLNGREWLGWFRGRPLPPSPAVAVGILSLRSDGRQVTVEFQPVHPAPATLQVSLVLLGFDIHNAVVAGENTGRTLNHDFVVLAYTTTPLERHGNRFQGRLTLPALAPGRSARAIAAWISRPGDPAPLQAVGGWL